MSLRIGKMTNKELAEWFGISDRTYKNTRAARLEELRWYCDFAVIRGGIDVKIIKHKDYIKNRSKIGKEIREMLPEVWPAGEPHTCVQVGTKIYEMKKSSSTEQVSTYIYQTRQQRTVLVGKPSPDNPYCHYVLVKAYRGNTDADTKMVELTPDEIKRKMLSAYFTEDIDLSIVFDLYADGMAAEAMKEVMQQTGWTSAKYRAYLDELALALKCDYITRGTKIIEYPTDNPWGEVDEIKDDEWLSSTVE